MANTKISALTANTNPNGSEEFVYAYNNANGKITLNTVKSFVGGAGITTLNADANIWELSEGIYETAYDLYYKSGEKVIASSGGGVTKKQMLFVTQESGGYNGYLVYNVGNAGGTAQGFACFGYSASSSNGYCYQLGDRAWALQQYSPATTSSIDALGKNTITQIVNNLTGIQEILLDDSPNRLPFPGVTYTIYVASVGSNPYTVNLGTGVTNPFGITLPTNSNKKCLITVLVTSTTTAIVTGCTIES